MRQGELLLWLVGGVYPPAQATHGRFHCRLIDHDSHSDLPFHSHSRWSPCVTSHRTLMFDLLVTQLQQPLNPMPFQDRLCRLAQGFDLVEALLATSSPVEGRQRFLGLRQSLLEPTFCRFSMLERTNHQAPFSPGDCLPIYHRRQRFCPFIALRDEFLLAGCLFPVDGSQTLLLCPDRSQVSLQCLLRQLGFRQRAQIEVISGFHKSACLQRSHLAVPNVQQPATSYALPDSRDGWDVQGVVGPVPRKHIGGQWHSQRIQRCQHHFHLRLAFLLSLAMPQLEQAVRCDRPVAANRCAVQTRPLCAQVIHPQQALVQRALEVFPSFIVTQSTQNTPESVVAEVQGTHQLLGTASQRLQPLRCPRLDVVQSMIGLREHMRQPTHGHPSQTDPLPIAMGRKVLVHQRLYAHALLLRKQHRYVVDSFTDNGKLLGHAKSLPQSPKLVKK